MLRNRRMLGNLIAVLTVWTVSGFSFFMLDFYVKYFPGSVFFNKALFGLVDAAGLFYIQFVQKFFKSVANMVRVTMASTILLCLLYTVAPLSFIPAVIALIRMQVNSMMSYGYHINQCLFPVLMRGTVFSLANAVSRPFVASAAIVAEYTSNPLIMVMIASIICAFATFCITEEDSSHLLG